MRISGLSGSQVDYVSRWRTEHHTEILTETEFNKTHYFWLCHKRSCFNKHYKARIMLSNCTWTKRQGIYVLKRYGRTLYVHNTKHLGKRTKCQMNIYKEQLYELPTFSFLPMSHPWQQSLWHICDLCCLHGCLLTLQGQSTTTWSLVFTPISSSKGGGLGLPAPNLSAHIRDCPWAGDSGSGLTTGHCPTSS